MKKLTVLLVLTLATTGCAMSGQKFTDDSWSIDVTQYNPETGDIISEVSKQWQTVRGKNRTMAPPFQAKAVAGHMLDMTQDGQSWAVQMGSRSDIDGGDITAAIEALESTLMDTILETLIGL